MSGPSALTNAIAGIEVTQARIDTITRNISNAQTVGYNAKIQNQAIGPSGIVMALPVQRAVNEGLQRLMLSSNGTVSSLTTTVNLMQNLTSLFGTPDAATTVSAKITALQTTYQDLSANPDNQSVQQSVLGAANSVASSFQQLNSGINNAISSATDQINTGLTNVNSILQQITEVNKEIRQTGNLSTDMTDLQDHLDNLLSQLSNYMDFNTFAKTDGTTAVYTTQGMPLVDETMAATVGLDPNNQLQVTTPESGPVSAKISSGSLGALLTARNVTFPRYQAQLDNIAGQLAQHFQGIGVSLFTDGPNAYNPANQPGYAGRITVNSTYMATPSMLRDGDTATPLSAGDTTNIEAALAIFSNNTIAFTAPGLPSTGTIAQVAANFVAGTAVTGQQASDTLSQETAVQQNLKNQISSESGVNVDQQVAQLTMLQQAYSANARMIQAARDMFTTLLSAVGQ